MAVEDDSWAPLFVGAVVGGPTARNRPLSDGVGLLARLADEAPWTPSEDETGVDVVFHIPGPLMAPDYEGVRSGSLSRRERLIMVQVAVPDEVCDEGPEGVAAHLAARLVEAVDLAVATVAKRKAALPVWQAVPMARSVADRIAGRG
ncbi:hypothetical protein [Streptomyces sp. NPDC003023]|uniref:hypothetical protein n=1 Tax=Streptomyces sp. NPDC003023 TaxID=3364675 RepID=UPI003683C15A